MPQHIGITMDVDRAVLGAGRIVPSPARELHDPGQHRIDHDRAGEAGAARIVNPHHIAVFDPALLGIVEMCRAR